MSKPNYRVTLAFDGERKLFLARCPELEHCTAEGATRAEAIQKLEEEINAQLANMLSHGTQPPRSVDEEEFSGEVSAKISKTLHRDLAYAARSEGIELDQLVGELLASALEGRRGTRGGARFQGRSSQGPHDDIGNRHDGNRGNSGRGFGRGSNTQLLDDRASFIEYVRGLEQGGGAPHRAQHGGHGHGGPRGGGGDNGRRRGRGGRGGSGGGGNFRPHDRGGFNGQRNGAPHGNGHNGQSVAPAAPPAPTGAPSMGDGGGSDDTGNV